MSPPQRERRPVWEPDGAQDQPGEAITHEDTSCNSPVARLDRIAADLAAQRIHLQVIAGRADRCGRASVVSTERISYLEHRTAMAAAAVQRAGRGAA